NRLANESSPYLQMHKDNPVDWYPWGQEALDAAKAQNKPILLSIGYSACHWCHVMEEESFRDPETAAQMNANFINIKVDREERPDLDQIYQAAANLMGHSGGWPLTIWLNPKTEPFFVGTYFPKEERFNTPPFKQVMSDVLTIIRGEQGEQAMKNAAMFTEQLHNLWNRDMRGPLDAGIVDFGALRIGQKFDIFFGGITGQMKFPSAVLTEVLWRAFLRSGQPQFMQLASNTLDHILLGGLFDHVGGGFHRYCVDERWLTPHFEKMLNDQGLLIDLMVSFWQFNRNGLCQSRIEDTVAFLLRDMKNGEGFASSFDADTNGEEGAYYLWTEPEIDAALMGTFAAKFKTAYSVTREGNLNGKNVLQRLYSAAPFPQPDADEALLAKQRELLLQARQKRTAPRRDDKVLCDWNAITIAALANAGAVLKKTEWTTAAIRAFDFIVKALGDGDHLYHSWLDGKRGVRGFADDYAHMARAALVLYEVVGDKRYLDHAKRWTRILNTEFWDTAQGGYFFRANNEEPLLVRTRMLFDQPAPSANNLMLEVMSKLYMLTADNEYRERINTMVNGFASEAHRAHMSMGSFFNGFEFALSELHIVVVGPLTNPKTHELVDAVLGRVLPNKLLSVVAPEEQFPTGHPMYGKTMLNGQPTVYICQRGTCSAPVTNPVTLSQMLQLPPQRPAQPMPPGAPPQMAQQQQPFV
ncbi:MAG: thioredoxin domain-containing protein, partial [Alphaproteobacteria bacterium]|nr:thioredoxin domain-containing protein [Alphaproteobacteria bacterium]